jgi:hypothetical protein
MPVVVKVVVSMTPPELPDAVSNVRGMRRRAEERWPITLTVVRSRSATPWFGLKAPLAPFRMPRRTRPLMEYVADPIGWE